MNGLLFWFPRSSRGMTFVYAILINLLFIYQLHASSPPQFSLPIACKPNHNCWIVNYVDHDLSAKARDYRCGKRSYNGHKGTDFVIVDQREMNEGIPVLAASDGYIIAIRDSIKDKRWKPSDGKSVKGKECGNRVTIKHTKDWHTDYCHLRKNSIHHKLGDKVKRGEVIGLVGLSGKTQMPHLHFAVYHHGKIIDPFNPSDTGNANCTEPKYNLWTPQAYHQLKYHKTNIFASGFTDQKPNFEQLKIDTNPPEDLSRHASLLGLWAGLYGIEKDDTVSLDIFDPDGETLLHSQSTITRNQARRYVFAGKRRKNAFWLPGRYQGVITVMKTDGNTLKKTSLIEIR